MDAALAPLSLRAIPRAPEGFRSSSVWSPEPRDFAGVCPEEATHMVGKKWVVAVTVAMFGTAALAAEYPDKKTERLWKSKCASCHGMDGKAQTDKGKEMKIRDMTSAEYQKKVTDEDIKKSMMEGTNRVKDGVKQEMDSYKDSLKPEQMDELAKYVRWVGQQK
jgi:cytochrome c6